MWIEILRPRLLADYVPVILYARMWIEMACDMQFKLIVERHPLCEDVD